MANEEQLNFVKQGVESWNQWREQNLDIKPDLSESDLRQANLQKANLSHANLNKVKLQFSNLTEANLKETSLKKAKLQEANLQGANLQSANLNGATGLSSSQIDLAITDKQTKLPEYLEEETDEDFLLQF